MRSIGSSRRAASVVIVGVGRQGMGMLRECLRTEATLPNAAVEFEEAQDQIRRQRPNVLIASFDGSYQQAVALGQEISAASPNITLVAFASASDPERIRAAMRAGYREYVVLPDDSELLRQAVHDAAYTPDADDERGELITICGSKGGVGVTSLAINLAAEISAVHRICVVDMDFSMGDVASFLDLRPQRSINDLLNDLERLDERVLQGSMAVHPSKVYVLAQPQEIETTDEVRGEDVLRLLQVATEAYQYCLVDCGCHIDEATLTSLTVSDTVFLVTEADVPSVKNAWRRLQLFERLGIETERIRLIVNKLDKRSQLGIKDIERHLGIRVAATVSADERTLSEAVNVGKLVRDVNRRSPAAEDYSNMVSLITEGDEFIEVKEKGSKSPFSFLFN
ncbi:MAG: AAA family ATPase [Alphaproteobacteria bacterium]|nr:AAA family ATPase [Alphaproteobacteria bacterium]